jgi:protein-tyrosine phosphatase
MIDMHSHILPGIDDGAREITETLSLLKEAEEAGFTTIVSTSHYGKCGYEVDEKERSVWINQLTSNLKNIAPKLTLALGNEIYVSNHMIEDLKEHRSSTINGTRYVLFELPFHDRVANLKDIIYDLISNKYTPIIAHPERYDFVQKNPNELIELLDLGVLFQSNYGSIIGQYGTKAKKTVELLIKNNFVHFLGSDVHRENTIYKEIPKALKYLGEIIPKEEVDELTTINAKLVLAGEQIDTRRPIKIKKGLFGFK